MRKRGSLGSFKIYLAKLIYKAVGAAPNLYTAGYNLYMRKNAPKARKRYHAEADYNKFYKELFSHKNNDSAAFEAYMKMRRHIASNAKSFTVNRGLMNTRQLKELVDFAAGHGYEVVFSKNAISMTKQ